VGGQRTLVGDDGVGLVEREKRLVHPQALERGRGGRAEQRGTLGHELDRVGNHRLPLVSARRSATRQALAMMVSVGLAPVPVGKGPPSTA
jgi:hypothetical protein